jgi:putative colanic acid biosynthesis acetyltransferase WcaF
MVKLLNRELKSSPSFSLGNRTLRVIWKLTHFLLIKYSPTPFKRWRAMIYRIFGATLNGKVNIYPNAIVWAPWNLIMETGSCIANGANIYNQDIVNVGSNVLISQGVYICTGTHDFNSSTFDLITEPIILEKNSWICAHAFIGPGVIVGEGAILGARGVACKDLKAWSINVGNPAKKISERMRAK